ncbi:MAG: tetratricopeptide repeat protein [Bacillota bacterium]
MVRGTEMKARSLIARGQLSLASDLLRDRILATEDPSPKLLNLLGICEARQGRREAAREAFIKALARSPRDPAALTNLGNLAFLEGDHDTARELYNKALRQNVFLPEPRFNLVRSYQEMGHFEKAMSAFEDYSMLAKTAKWSRLLFLLGAILLFAFLLRR